MSGLGSNSEVRARNWEVRFTLTNRRRQPGLSRPKSARGGSEVHMEQRDPYLIRSQTNSVVRISPPTDIGGVVRVIFTDAIST